MLAKKNLMEKMIFSIRGSDLAIEAKEYKNKNWKIELFEQGREGKVLVERTMTLPKLLTVIALLSGAENLNCKDLKTAKKKLKNIINLI